MYAGKTMHDRDDGRRRRSANGLWRRPDAGRAHGGRHGAHPADDMGRQPALLGGVLHVGAVAAVGVHHRLGGGGAGELLKILY